MLAALPEYRRGGNGLYIFGNKYLKGDLLPLFADFGSTIAGGL
jgi:hypothetical protein